VLALSPCLWRNKLLTNRGSAVIVCGACGVMSCAAPRSPSGGVGSVLRGSEPCASVPRDSRWRGRTSPRYCPRGLGIGR
jgi:hypothetical protein